MHVSSPATNVPSAAASASTAKAGQKATLNYDNFLQLLMTQMKNQDPTEPMKSAEYMGQLASFSQVEQSVDANSKLDALLSSATFSQAGGVIGRTVTSSDQSVSGRVISVESTNAGAVATLDGGKKLALGSGVTVS
jgi:flagellar basal-body rod modification protein FlgD